ncbi:hypothetical protein LEP1GSC108_2706 [Leptospira weilii str. UI 13098]|uniref:Uncharacterized protein n=1 Tax=Leptospira weilii str. UI 13098 TaxID=1088542 RepID=M6Q9J5_9LEPT|nr:hypothetical protein LEP1GSC108_2706 [Leptospira weilii str. UI 13098]
MPEFSLILGGEANKLYFALYRSRNRWKSNDKKIETCLNCND